VPDALRSSCVAAAISLAGISSVAGAAAQMVPMTFEEVVAEAETIILARTVDRRSRWEETRDGKFIVTQVVLAVEKVYKGPSMTQTTMEYLGGTIGDMAFGVEGMPTFNRGDRDVLFISSEVKPVNPIVGGTAGRFRVARDPRTGADAVRTAEGLAFTNVSQLGQFAQPEQAPGATAVPPMSLQEFEGQLAKTLAHGRR